MIELKNIIKDYKSSDTVVHALKGVSLSFRENEFVAILGPSGGGKTTLLNIIGGLDKYSSGDLIINGKSTVKYKDKDWDTYRNHSVGFIFQSYNLIPHQTVLANVELALTIAGIGKQARKERAIEVLEKVGLADQIHKKPNQLSGGQMQRVAIARALINDPDILLADEPTGALDSKTSVQIMDLLKEVAQDKLVVMVTHNPELAYEYANRIVKIHDGEIIDDSNPYQEEPSNRVNKTGKAKMRLSTALSLSLQNLWTKKARTILVGFAGSIGIIGIALILSLSTGVNNYIDEVQENSLSSYPLTIENSTVDFTSAMTAMMGTIEARQEVEGSVVEVPVMTELFSSVDVGENNLKKFKEYLESNQETIDKWASSVQYSYGISLNIYKSDTHLKVNPSELMSSSMMSYYSSYSFSNTFFEVLDNQELLESQYEMLAGKWSTNYNEVILVLSDKYAISDFTLYSLGLKDQSEFEELLKAAMKGESSTIQSNPLTLSYEELLGLEYKLVLPTSYYVYDKTYNAWVDKSEDEEYLSSIIDNGLTLKIVGVVAPKDGVSSTALSQGIGYSHSLIEWAINEASKTDIVKAQLEKQDIDVFSGNSFEDINNKTTESKLNFQDMISIDEEKLTKAFGGNFDQSKIQNIITKQISNAMNAIVINDDELSTDLLSEISSKSMDMVITYLNTNGNGVTAQFDENDIESIVNDYFKSFDYSEMEEKYGIGETYLKPFYTELFKAVLSGYYEYAVKLAPLSNKATLTKTTFSAFIALFISSDELTNAVDLYSTTIVEAKIKEKVGIAMGNLSSGIISEISNSMKVDPDLIASAFTFNMSEEDLTALMSTLNSTSTMKSCASNLTKLGYHDLSDPTSIAVYLYDFESKDNFKDFIEDYNQQQTSAGLDKDVISYTDITGILMSSIQTIINAISYILIAFVSVSLVVSSIMIGIITYISVIERTKEIGVLRSLGASKKDVGNIFSAETFIIGLLAGAIGVLSTMLMCIPINIIIRKLTNIASLKAELPLFGAIGLVIISVILTLIAGIFPSSKASKCDPVIALRSE